MPHQTIRPNRQGRPRWWMTMDKRAREWVLLGVLLARQMPPTWLEAGELGVPP